MFNFRKEKAIFGTKWSKLEKQYITEGMSKEVINELYEFDYELFRKRRNRINNSSDISLDEGSENGVNVEQFLFTNKHYIEMEKDLFTNRYEWVEHIERIDLVDKLKKLSQEDLELLTLYAFDNYSQAQIAVKYGISQKNICKKIKRIKLFLI